VLYNDIPVQGTPVRVNVDAANGHYISAFGSGLVQGASGQQLQFSVTGHASIKQRHSSSAISSL
jgi:hypothetical protein